MFIFIRHTPVLRLTEVFHSIQGEGPLIGIPMLFVRTNRCNLRCRWCDSTYTFEGGYEENLDNLLAEIEKWNENWICLTGGEPLLQRDSIELVRKISESGRSVLIETGGSLDLKKFTELENTVIDMDVKTPSSGEQDSIHLENLDYLRPTDYIKFVIADETDYAYMKEFLVKNEGKIKCGVVVQPAWGTELKWLTEKILGDRLKARVLPQLHKLIWGEIPGV